MNIVNMGHPLATCGAKSKLDDSLCIEAAMPNGKCHQHGGATPAEIKARSGRLYSKHLSDEDRALMLQAVQNLSSVDEELCVARVMLARALKGLAVDENKCDWYAVIDRCLGRVGSLTKVRHDLASSDTNIMEIRIFGGLPD